MKKTLKTIVAATAGLCALAVQTAPGAAEADKLGKELTPVGAERAGNGDNSIPAWSGATAKPQGKWAWGDSRGDVWQHKGDKPLFTIDASNVNKYADKLSPGQIEMIRQLKGYQMTVYPSRRECAMPDFVLNNTKANAGKARLAGDGWSLEDAALPGVPFPMPKSGLEVVWNYIMRYQGLGMDFNNARITVSPRPGTSGGVVARFNQTSYFPWGKKGAATPAQLKGVQQGFYYAFNEPAALAGQSLVQTFFLNKDAEAFYYFTGQRRVRRLPNYAYDTPVIGFENQLPNDGIFLFQGNPDRFEWKIVGKKEMYIQYNNFDIVNPRRKAQGIEQPFIDNDLRRYELHRVWVVEGKVKSGVRHSAARKVFYFDEDTWLAVNGEDYDSQGKLWRQKEAGVFPVWEIGACSNTGQYYLHDFTSGRYVVDASVLGGGKEVRFYAEPEGNPRMKDEFYTAENLRAISDR